MRLLIIGALLATLIGCCRNSVAGIAGALHVERLYSQNREQSAG